MRVQQAQLVLLSTCAVLVGATPAWAQQVAWSVPDTVPSSEGGVAPAVEGSAAGVAVAFLRPRQGGDDADVILSRRSGFGGWDTAEVSERGAPAPPDASPALAISRSGAVAAAWLARPPDSEADPRIDVVLGSLAGDLQRRTIPAALLGRDASNVTISVDDAGQALLGWTMMDGRGTRTDEDDVTRARILLVGPGDATGDVGELSTPADGDIAELRSRSNPAGNVVFGWIATQTTETASGATSTTTTSTRVGGAVGRPGSFTVFALPGDSAERVSVNEKTDAVLTQGERLAQVRVGVADDGRALVAFQRFRSDDQDEPDRPTDVTRIETLVAAGSIGHGFDPATVHSDAARPDDADELPLSFDVAPDGQAMIAGLAGPDGREAFVATGDVTGAFSPDSALGAADEVDAAARGAGHTVALGTGAAGLTASLDGMTPQPLAGLDAFPKRPDVTGLGDGSAIGVWQIDPLPLPMNVGDEAIRFSDLRQPAPAPASDPSPPAAVNPPPPPPPPPPTTTATQPAPAPVPLVPASQPDSPPADASAPEISALALSPDLFRVGASPSAFAAPGLARAASHAAGPRARAAAMQRGGALTFALSESAWVRFTISRMVTKRRGRSRCPKAQRRRGGPVRRVGILKRTFSNGPQSLAVSGRIRRDALSRGRYVLRVRAVDPAGNLSRIEGVRFTVC
jgi:hypothetical protein